MKKINEATYTKDLNLQDIYYFVRWSAYYKYDKYEILKKVPELAGIFVLLYLTKAKRLRPFYLGNSWMGSLRHDIKFFIDEPEKTDQELTEIIENKTCYYKYLLVPSIDDMKDIYSYYRYSYREIQFMDNNIQKDSGRYVNVFVKEYEKNKEDTQ
jgi:hypothetical protein